MCIRSSYYRCFRHLCANSANFSEQMTSNTKEIHNETAFDQSASISCAVRVPLWNYRFVRRDSKKKKNIFSREGMNCHTFLHRFFTFEFRIVPSRILAFDQVFAIEFFVDHLSIQIFSIFRWSKRMSSRSGTDSTSIRVRDNNWSLPFVSCAATGVDGCFGIPGIFISALRR